MAGDLIEKACKESNSISDYLILRENSKPIGKDTAEIQVLYKSPEQVTSSEMAFCNDLTKQFYIQAESRGWVECGSRDIEDGLAVAIESDSRYLIVKTKDSAVSDSNSLQSFILFKFSSDWEDDEHEYTEDDEHEYTEDDEHEYTEDQIQIHCLYVYQLHTRILSRGKGNGSRMLDILEDLARKYQFPKIKLTVLKGNEQAIQLYKRRGYNLDTTDPSNFDLPTDHELYNVGYWIFSKNTFRNH